MATIQTKRVTISYKMLGAIEVDMPSDVTNVGAWAEEQIDNASFQTLQDNLDDDCDSQVVTYVNDEDGDSLYDPPY